MQTLYLLLLLNNEFVNFRSFPDQKTIGYITSKMAKIEKIIDHRDESLNVFILNDKTEEEMTESLQLFVEIYSSRKRTDREFWLLDTTHLQADKGNEGIFDELKELKLDLDDDLYLFNNGAEGTVMFQDSQVIINFS